MSEVSGIKHRGLESKHEGLGVHEGLKSVNLKVESI